MVQQRAYDLKRQPQTRFDIAIRLAARDPALNGAHVLDARHVGGELATDRVGQACDQVRKLQVQRLPVRQQSGTRQRLACHSNSSNSAFTGTMMQRYHLKKSIKSRLIHVTISYSHITKHLVSE